MAGRIVILAAMKVEARAIARALELGAGGQGEWRSAAGRLPELHLNLVGLRAGRLRDEMLKGADCVIMAGVAGGLDPGLDLGDVVLEDSAGVLEERMPGVVTGRMYTAAEIVCTPAEKSAIFRQTEAAVVEMEMEIVRRAAERVGVPLIGLRAVLDDAACVLPDYLGKVTDDVGQPRILALAGRMFRRPVMVAELARLGRDADVALTALTRALVELVGRMAKSV